MIEASRLAHDDMLDIALSSAVEVLDCDRRPWMLGAAHMVNHPLTGEFSEEAVRSVIELAMTTLQFPSGPIDFIPAGFTQTLNPEYRMITLAGDSAPHLELKIGFGIAGVVAVRLTRSDILDDGSCHPGAVVLTDWESVLGDTVGLALGSAIELGYMGPIDFRFTVADRRPDVQLQMFRLEEDTAKVQACCEGKTQLEEVGGSIVLSAQSTPMGIHEFVYDLAVAVSRQFDTEPQLVTRPNVGDELYEGDPLHHSRMASPPAEEALHPATPQE